MGKKKGKEKEREHEVGAEHWTCIECTFNENKQLFLACEMCGKTRPDSNTSVANSKIEVCSDAHVKKVMAHVLKVTMS